MKCINTAPQNFFPTRTITYDKHNYNSYKSLGVHQVHKSDILVIDNLLDAQKLINPTTPTMDCDGILTNQAGLSLIIKTADCIPLLAYHRSSSWIGALHCGWKPIAGGIIPNFFKHAREVSNRLAGSGSIIETDWVFLLGPGICKECYEVGEDLIEVFNKLVPAETFADLAKQKSINVSPKKYMLDLKMLCIFFLEKAGVPREQILIDNNCSLTDERFNSHRGNGTKARNISFIVLHK